MDTVMKNSQGSCRQRLRPLLKNIKQYSYELDQKTLNELLFIGKKYAKVKNYVYSRFSGINSILLLGKDRKIRDEWVKTKFYEQWNLPARYWKLALSEAMGSIKSRWSNIKLRIKEQVKVNNNLSSDDKHYINYILKANELYHKILRGKKMIFQKYLKEKN